MRNKKKLSRFLFIITVLLTICRAVRASTDMLKQGPVIKICTFIHPVHCLNKSLTGILRANQDEMYEENPALLFRVMHPVNALHGIGWILDDCLETGLKPGDFALLKKTKTNLVNIFKGTERATEEELKAKLADILPMVIKETLLYVRQELKIYTNTIGDSGSKLPIKLSSLLPCMLNKFH